MEEDYIRASFGDDRNRQVSSAASTIRSSHIMEEEATTTRRAYFTGNESLKLLRVAKLVLHDSVFGWTPSSPSGSAPSLVKDIFLAFPHTALEAQIYSFQESVLAILADLFQDALSAGDTIPVSNTVAISGILFDNAQSGLFAPSSLTTALDLSLRIAREISGNRRD